MSSKADRSSRIRYDPNNAGQLLDLIENFRRGSYQDVSVNAFLEDVYRIAEHQSMELTKLRDQQKTNQSTQRSSQSMVGELRDVKTEQTEIKKLLKQTTGQLSDLTKSAANLASASSRVSREMQSSTPLTNGTTAKKSSLNFGGFGGFGSTPVGKSSAPMHPASDSSSVFGLPFPPPVTKTSTSAPESTEQTPGFGVPKRTQTSKPLIDGTAASNLSSGFGARFDFGSPPGEKSSTPGPAVRPTSESNGTWTSLFQIPATKASISAPEIQKIKETRGFNFGGTKRERERTVIDLTIEPEPKRHAPTPSAQLAQATAPTPAKAPTSVPAPANLFRPAPAITSPIGSSNEFDGIRVTPMVPNEPQSEDKRPTTFPLFPGLRGGFLSNQPKPVPLTSNSAPKSSFYAPAPVPVRFVPVTNGTGFAPLANTSNPTSTPMPKPNPWAEPNVPATGHQNNTGTIFTDAEIALQAKERAERAKERAERAADEHSMREYKRLQEKDLVRKVSGSHGIYRSG